MAKDPYWSDVVTLLHCDSLTEVKTSATLTTAAGSPSVDTSIKKYGSGSLRNTSSTGYYNLAAAGSEWDFGTDPFTIEFSFVTTASPQYRYIFGCWSSSAVYPQWRFSAEDYNPKFYIADALGTTVSYDAPNSTFVTGVWYAICIQRDSSGVLTIWSNRYDATTLQYTQNSLVTQAVSGGANSLKMGAINLNTSYIDEVRITKGVARYTTSTYALPSEAFVERDYDIFEDGVSDSLSVWSYPSWGYIYPEDLSTALSVTDGIVFGGTRSVSDSALVIPSTAPIIGRVASSSDSATISESASVTLSALLRDFVTLADSTGVKAKYTTALSELVNAQERLAAGKPVSLQDSVGVTWALGVVQGARLAEQLRISEVLNYPFRYRLSVTEAVRLYDALANFFSFDISETITATETMGALARHFVALNQSAALSETVTPRLVLRATASDAAVFDDSFDIKMLFKPVVQEQITFTAMFASPSGGVTTWTINTRTGAVTEYENFNFNSFANLGVHYLGASADGLYALDGTDDDGTPTVARLKSGYAQFGGSRFASFKSAYLGIRGDGDIYLKLHTADGKTYTYKTVIQDQETTKVRLGKGLRARYFAFELITVGQDFDLDTVEFVPLVAQRRV